MNVRFTPRATQDIAEIAAYIRARNPQAAARVRDSILDGIQTLVLFPKSGRRQDVEGVRKLVTKKHHYLVYYVADLDAEEVVVLTIQHRARDREYTDD